MADAKESGLAAAREVLRSRAVRHVFMARSLSVLGDMLVPVALAFAVLGLTGSATDLGIVLAARATPAVLLLLVGGVVGDRHDRRSVMVASHATAFVTQGLAGILILADTDGIWWLAALMAARGATSAFFNPASTGAIASIARAGYRQQTFALFGIVETVAEFAGPALAGVLLLFLNPGWVLVIDAATFLVSFLLIAFAGELGRPDAAAKSRSFRESLTGGLQFVRRTPWLLNLIASSTVFQFSMLSTIAVLGPVVADRSLGGSSAWAAIATALGVGGVAGSLLGVRFTPRRPLYAGYALLLLGAGPTLFLLAVPAPLIAVLASEFVAGLVIGFFTILENTALAQHVPETMYSRVDSVSRVGSLALRPVGLALVGPVSVLIGVQATLIVAGLIAMSAVVVPLFAPSTRALTSDEERAPEP
jgi:MFS family permease